VILQGIATFACPQIRAKSGLNLWRRAKSGDFPQFFPQVWKTLGRDQIDMESAGRTATEKDADCNTIALD
jgi:hypothetical protein